MGEIDYKYVNKIINKIFLDCAPVKTKQGSGKLNVMGDGNLRQSHDGSVAREDNRVLDQFLEYAKIQRLGKIIANVLYALLSARHCPKCMT